MALIAMLLLAGVGGGYFYRAHRVQAFSDKDTVVMADFVNATGDPVFSDTLQQALQVALRQSPYISIVPASRILSTLKLMGRANDERLSTDVARDLAQRVRAKAVIVGTITQLGTSYVITLGAVNAVTGDTIAQDQVQSASKEEVLAAVGQAASHLRQRLGESLASVARLDKPLEEATTSSLEALRNYSLGEQTRQNAGDLEALKFYRRAVELDPNFALAYARLGTIYANLGETRMSEENTRKAFELKDRVSEYEKLYITSHYYEFVTLEDDKALKAYEDWARTYPRDFTPILNSAVVLGNEGQFEKALEKSQEAMAIDPDHVLAYVNVIDFYCALERYDEAEAILAQAASRKLDSDAFHFFRYYIARQRGDETVMNREMNWAHGNPAEADMIGIDASLDLYRGKLERGRSQYRKAAALAVNGGRREAGAEYLISLGISEALLGNSADARLCVEEALKADDGAHIAGRAAVVMAMTGDRPRAEELQKQSLSQYPNATVLIHLAVPVVRSWLTADPADIVAELEPARMFERKAPMVLLRRGDAYLLAGSPDKARKEYERALAPGETKDYAGPEKALARLGLARAYAQLGDRAKARASYQDFLALWNGADQGIPVLQQAKSEYAHLP